MYTDPLITNTLVSQVSMALIFKIKQTIEEYQNRFLVIIQPMVSKVTIVAILSAVFVKHPLHVCISSSITYEKDL